MRGVVWYMRGGVWRWGARFRGGVGFNLMGFYRWWVEFDMWGAGFYCLELGFDSEGAGFGWRWAGFNILGAGFYICDWRGLIYEGRLNANTSCDTTHHKKSLFKRFVAAEDFAKQQMDVRIDVWSVYRRIRWQQKVATKYAAWSSFSRRLLIKKLCWLFLCQKLSDAPRQHEVELQHSTKY